MDVAGGRARLTRLQLRSRPPVRGGTAPRHRHPGCDRAGRTSTVRRRRLVRGDGPGGWKDDLYSCHGRDDHHAPPSRRDRRPARLGRDRGRGRGHGRNVGRSGGTGAARLPGDSHDRGSAGLSGPDRLPAGPTGPGAFGRPLPVRARRRERARRSGPCGRSGSGRRRAVRRGGAGGRDRARCRFGAGGTAHDRVAVPPGTRPRRRVGNGCDDTGGDERVEDAGGRFAVAAGPDDRTPGRGA